MITWVFQQNQRITLPRRRCLGRTVGPAQDDFEAWWDIRRDARHPATVNG
jgi:hypothetical protein